MIKLPTIERPRPRPQRRTLPELPYPHQAEHDYVATLLFVAKQTTGTIRGRLLPALGRILDEETKRAPRVDGVGDRLRALIVELRSSLAVSVRTARGWALAMLHGVSEYHARVFVREYGQDLAVNPMIGNEDWLPDAMRVAVEQNVSLIQSIPTQCLDQVEHIAQSGVLGGRRGEDIAAEIVSRFGVTENRAILIAQDQVGKTLGSLNRLRQVDAGVTHYTWSTSQDERVRPMHRALEGTRQSWQRPPVVTAKGARAHPGHDVRCRCAAIPILPEYGDLDQAAEE